MSDTQPIEMYICETEFLILRPNQPYIFRVHPHCERCTRLEQVYADQEGAQ